MVKETEVMGFRVPPWVHKEYKNDPSLTEGAKDYIIISALRHRISDNPANEFLNKHLKDKTPESFSIRCVRLIVNMSSFNEQERLDYRRTVERFSDPEGIALPLCDAIWDDWIELLDKLEIEGKLASKYVRGLLTNMSEYKAFEQHMRECMNDIQSNMLEALYVLADYLVSPNPRHDGSFDLNDDKDILDEIDCIYGEDTMNNVFQKLFDCGAIKRHYWKSRSKNKYDGISFFEDSFREFLLIRERTKTQKVQRMRAELETNPQLFKLIQKYYDASCDEPYRKFGGSLSGDPEEMRSLIKNNWILVGYGYTYLSPEGLEVIKEYSLRRS